MKKQFLINDELYTSNTEQAYKCLTVQILKDDTEEISYKSKLEFPSKDRFQITLEKNKTIEGYYKIEGSKIFLSINGKSFILKGKSTQLSLGEKNSEYKSPMPGKVLSIAVKNGDSVVEGQNLLIIEAMKIENMIQARSSGKVSQINCKVGELVDPETVLLTIS